MRLLDLEKIVLDLCGWLSREAAEELPSDCVCEALITYALAKSLKLNKCSAIKPEWRLSNSEPYKSHDLMANFQGEQHVFEIKFVRRSLYRLGLVKDLMRLYSILNSTRHCYLLVVLDCERRADSFDPFAAIIDKDTKSFSLSTLAWMSKNQISELQEKYHIPNDWSISVEDLVERRTTEYRVLIKKLVAPTQGGGSRKRHDNLLA